VQRGKEAEPGGRGPGRKFLFADVVTIGGEKEQEVVKGG